MKKGIVTALALVLLSGCAKTLTMDRTGFTDVNGNFFDMAVARDLDRAGTEAKHFMVIKDGQVVSQGTVSGRGILAGMTDGTVPALVQAGGLAGLGALMPGTKIENNNQGSTGGNAFQAQGQAQDQLQNQCQTQAQSQRQTLKSSISNTSFNCNTVSGGWTPPGQNK